MHTGQAVLTGSVGLSPTKTSTQVSHPDLERCYANRGPGTRFRMTSQSPVDQFNSHPRNPTPLLVDLVTKNPRLKEKLCAKIRVCVSARTLEKCYVSVYVSVCV